MAQRKPFNLSVAWKLYKSGYTLKRLAQKLRRSASGIHKLFKAAGKKLRPPGHQVRTTKARR